MRVSDRDRHRGGGSAFIGILNGVGECIDAVEVGVGRVVDRGVWIHHDRSVGRFGRRNERKQLAQGIAIVTGHVDRDRRLFWCRGWIVDGIGSRVDTPGQFEFVKA